jgi:hypothetical protein
MEDDQEVVKRSGRNEPIWVATHMCMEAMLGISLCSCLYLKLTKLLCLSYYLLCFLFNKIGEKGRTGPAWKQEGLREEGGSGGQGGGMAQTMYTHMNK